MLHYKQWAYNSKDKSDSNDYLGPLVRPAPPPVIAAEYKWALAWSALSLIVTITGWAGPSKSYIAAGTRQGYRHPSLLYCTCAAFDAAFYLRILRASRATVFLDSHDSDCEVAAILTNKTSTLLSYLFEEQK